MKTSKLSTSKVYIKTASDVVCHQASLLSRSAITIVYPVNQPLRPVPVPVSSLLPAKNKTINLMGPPKKIKKYARRKR